MKDSNLLAQVTEETNLHNSKCESEHNKPEKEKPKIVAANDVKDDKNVSERSFDEDIS